MIDLKEVPILPRPEAAEHMRTHVYLNITISDRQEDDTCYRLAGFRLWCDRDVWYSGTDLERSIAVSTATNRLAELTNNRPKVSLKTH